MKAAELCTCPNSGEMIHIALAVYDPSGTFSQHAGVVITSIFENTSSPVTIHILHDDTLTQENRGKFIRNTQKYSQKIEFIDMSNYRKILHDRFHKIVGQFTVGALYRIFIPEILPGLERIIYLDCDVLVNLDISELWNIELDNKAIAGVVDIAAYKISRDSTSRRGIQIKLCGLEVNQYVNSGVLLMNCDKMRQYKNFSESVTNWLEKYYYLAPSLDQDAINVILKGDIKFIDEKFNVWDLSQDISDSIIHFWMNKPWVKFTGSDYEKLYWQMYTKSAWGENCTLFDIIDKLRNIGMHLSNEEYTSFFHRHGKECIGHFGEKILHELDNFMQTVKLRYYLMKQKFLR